LEITDWRALKDDELPDVTSVGQHPVSELWDCVHCWRVGDDHDLEEPTQAREHLLDA